MLNFNQLKVENREIVQVKKPVLSKSIPNNQQISFQQLVGNEPIKKKNVLTKEEIERRRTTEPGNKIPTANYQQIAQYCETCEDVTTHVHNPEKKKLRCLTCKNDKSYGSRN